MIMVRRAGAIMLCVTQMCVIQVFRHAVVRGRVVARRARNTGERRACEPAGGKAERNENDE